MSQTVSMISDSDSDSELNDAGQVRDGGLHEHEAPLDGLLPVIVREEHPGQDQGTLSPPWPIRRLRLAGEHDADDDNAAGDVLVGPAPPPGARPSAAQVKKAGLATGYVQGMCELLGCLIADPGASEDA